MRVTLMLLAGLLMSGAVAAEDGRYEALPLPGGDARSGSRALILDTREGHVWIWSENELVTTAGGDRRYGSVFIYQGRLRPGSRPGEVIDANAH